MDISRPFESSRLRFRLLEPDDREFVYRQFSDQDMCRYLSEPPMTREQARETIAFFQDPVGKPYLRYGVFHRESGEFVGTCGYHHWDEELRQVELGYDIWKTFRGNGYASEALAMLLLICFRYLDVCHVYVLIHRDNSASIRTAARAGFSQSDPCRALDEPLQVCMKLTRRTWEERDVLHSVR